jgi:hypothetical protein
MKQTDIYTFIIISRRILLKMRNVSDKICRENKNTHFVFFFPEKVPFMTVWKNIVQLDRSQMTVWCMCIACWTPTASQTHLVYVVLTAFLLQQWLHERASMLHLLVLPVL